jgi:hypothetical protein
MRWITILINTRLAQAAIRFGCSTVSVQRLDPLVEPGNVPSSHVHQVRRIKDCLHHSDRTNHPRDCGRQCFQRNDDRRYRRAGNMYNLCLHRGVSSTYKQDGYVLITCFSFSNYWTAALYFKHTNGSYKRVPQYPNAQLGHEGADAPDIKGGMTIYYTQKDFNGNGDQYITAFQPVSPNSSYHAKHGTDRCANHRVSV